MQQSCIKYNVQFVPHGVLSVENLLDKIITDSRHFVQCAKPTMSSEHLLVFIV